jgi:hypothetical protein
MELDLEARGGPLSCESSLEAESEGCKSPLSFISFGYSRCTYSPGWDDEPL